ncbi:hypothetical protein [Streptomyces sp. NBC_01244]|uniref:hypothetical protein n=1 Tax=Streptomyces sp. NBC_01244 TaxID=2903797 RepID=UPI002E141D85|nr:hypothetical protein OG247_41950 [Streptomyces sp. NBC_01244]
MLEDAGPPIQPVPATNDRDTALVWYEALQSKAARFPTRHRSRMRTAQGSRSLVPMSWPAISAFAASVTALVALLGALTALHRTRRQRQREFEDVCVKRYWELLDRLSLPTLRGLASGRRISDSDRHTVRLYFRLSEDEADLREQGWVSNATWQEWRGSIRSQLHRRPYERLWTEALEDARDGRDYEFRHLHNLGGLNGDRYDPWPPWYRRWLWRSHWTPQYRGFR